MKRALTRQPTEPTEREAVTIARILKVNHAGEYGAIRIYRAQIAISRILFPDIVAPLSHMLAHEIEHCARFSEAMPLRNARPCRIMSLWSLGGNVLGAFTAIMGRRWIWTCTSAVEETVHRHLDDQLHFLAGRDEDLHSVIQSIREQELEHLSTANARVDRTTWLTGPLRGAISSTTDALIWLSTWGDSSRMAHDLAQNSAGR
jgi:ubiquinone biosynthesis monooxygenase Coq7